MTLVGCKSQAGSTSSRHRGGQVNAMDLGEKRSAQQDASEGDKSSLEPPAATVGATTVTKSLDNPGDKVPSQKRARPNDEQISRDLQTTRPESSSEGDILMESHPTDEKHEPQQHDKKENKSDHVFKSPPPKPYEPYGPPSSMRMSTAVAYKARSSVPPPEMVTSDSATRKSEPQTARTEAITREDLLKAFAAPAESTVSASTDSKSANLNKAQPGTFNNSSSQNNDPPFQSRKVSVASSDTTPTTNNAKEAAATGAQQRKSISLPMGTDASVLGNAIAKAMAASATASRSSSGNPATAAVIGNLAANINTLLQNNGEKKAGEPGQIVSNSTITQMIDQAIRLGTRSTGNGNQNIGTTRTAKGKGKMPNKASTDAATTNEGENPEKPPEENKPKLIVKNDAVWEDLKNYKERRLGTRLYTPRMTLPAFEGQYNCLLDVLVPARYLSYDNEMVKKKTIWGTDIYTDDSDVVAMILHSGKYHLEFREPDLDPNDPLFKAIGAEPQEENNNAPRTAVQEPDHDLRVTLRLMPPLRSYQGCIRHHIKSRSFGPHSGCSLHVESVEKIKKGDAKLTSRMATKAFLKTVMCDPAWLNRSRR